MNLFSLVLYGLVNSCMILYYLREKGQYCHFPFWAGAIGMGWFFPQAIGGYLNHTKYPDNSYWEAVLFAALCSIAIWIGYHKAVHRVPLKHSWLDSSFDQKKLFHAGVFLCFFGFFFQWKLLNLPEEVLAQSQWSGTAVKYLFLAGAFKIGFVVIWLLYLKQSNLFRPAILIFIIPCLVLLFMPIILHGRRADMMNLTAYIVIGLWFVRRITVPRWGMILGLICGLILINSIGTYRLILKNESIPLMDRLEQASTANYIAPMLKTTAYSGTEFNNYVYYLKIIEEKLTFDFGLMHWNLFIFNYVPAQFVGSNFKQMLMLPLKKIEVFARNEYGHISHIGATSTGYIDAFRSFWWLGFIKFLLIGWIMGFLYQKASSGTFLGQLLYVFFLSSAMHSITHSTNDILVRYWVYFFMLGYPVIQLAKIKPLAHH
jgi:hypothetical protein